MKTIVLLLCFVPKYAEYSNELCYLENLPSYAESVTHYCEVRKLFSPEYEQTVCREFDEHTDVRLLR